MGDWNGVPTSLSDVSQDISARQGTNQVDDYVDLRFPYVAPLSMDLSGVKGGVNYRQQGDYDLGSLAIAGGDGNPVTFRFTGDLADVEYVTANTDGTYEVHARASAWDAGQTGVKVLQGDLQAVQDNQVVATNQTDFAVIPFDAPTGVSFTYDSIHDFGQQTSSGQALGEVFMNGIGNWDPSREDHLHLSTDRPDLLTFVKDPVSYQEKVKLTPGAQLLPGRDYQVAVSAYDDMHPDIAPVSTAYALNVAPTRPFATGDTGDWTYTDVATLHSGDTFDAATMPGGPDVYTYQVVGGRTDLFTTSGE